MNGDRTRAMPQPAAKGEATCDIQRENIPGETKMFLVVGFFFSF